MAIDESKPPPGWEYDAEHADDMAKERKAHEETRRELEHALHMEGEMRSAVYEETARADEAEAECERLREALASLIAEAEEISLLDHPDESEMESIEYGDPG